MKKSMMRRRRRKKRGGEKYEDYGNNKEEGKCELKMGEVRVV